MCHPGTAPAAKHPVLLPELGVGVGRGLVPVLAHALTHRQHLEGCPSRMNWPLGWVQPAAQKHQIPVRAQYNHESQEAIKFSKGCLGACGARSRPKGGLRPLGARDRTCDSQGPCQDKRGVIPPCATILNIFPLKLPYYYGNYRSSLSLRSR